LSGDNVFDLKPGGDMLLRDAAIFAALRHAMSHPRPGGRIHYAPDSASILRSLA
jgi:hypothetical protein